MPARVNAAARLPARSPLACAPEPTMDIVTELPYPVQVLDTSPAPSLPSATLIVKGAFKLEPDAPALPCSPEEQRQLEGDDIYLDDVGRSLRYATDLAPFKVHGEV